MKDTELLNISVQSSLIFQSLSRYTSLWNLSFAYCDPLPLNLTSITYFPCLGTVNFSHTNIDFRILQSVLHKTQVINLSVYGCAKIQAPEGEAANRGFILFVLPLVWVLNGVYITWIERKRWNVYFTRNIKGVYSELIRKWKALERADFVSSSHTTTTDEGGDAIWTINARKWLDYMPENFKMAVNCDLWKLDRLATEMYESQFCASTLGDTQPPSELYITFLGSSAGASMSQRSHLALLMIAVIFEFPKDTLHSVCEILFESDWTNHRVTPIFWSSRRQLEFLGLLLGRIQIDASSSINISKFHFNQKYIDTFQHIISLLLKHHTEPGTQGQVDKNLVLDTLLEIEMQEPRVISIMRLQVLELVCICPIDNLFLEYFHIYNNCLKNCVSILASNNAQLVTLMWSELELEELRVLGQLEKCKRVSAKILETKLRLNMVISHIYALLETHIEESE